MYVIQNLAVLEGWKFPEHQKVKSWIVARNFVNLASLELALVSDDFKFDGQKLPISISIWSAQISSPPSRERSALDIHAVQVIVCHPAESAQQISYRI